MLLQLQFYRFQYDCPEMVGLHGNDVRDYCCQKQSLPYDFLEFYLRFPTEEENIQKAESCSSSFANKQLELDPKLKAAVEKFDNSFDENVTATANPSDADNPRERLFNVMKYHEFFVFHIFYSFIFP